MDVSRVRALIPPHQMTRFESTHPWLLGFASSQGRDVPVVDLRAKLGLAAGMRGRQPIVVIVTAGKERLSAFLADRVSEMVVLRERDFRRGSAMVNGRPRKILDADSILTEEEYEQLPALILL